MYKLFCAVRFRAYNSRFQVACQRQTENLRWFEALGTTENALYEYQWLKQNKKRDSITWNLQNKNGTRPFLTFVHYILPYDESHHSRGRPWGVCARCGYSYDHIKKVHFDQIHWVWLSSVLYFVNPGMTRSRFLFYTSQTCRDNLALRSKWKLTTRMHVCFRSSKKTRGHLLVICSCLTVRGHDFSMFYTVYPCLKDARSKCPPSARSGVNRTILKNNTTRTRSVEKFLFLFEPQWPHFLAWIGRTEENGT